MTRPRFLILLYVLWMSFTAPVVAALWWADTKDWHPWLVLFGVGVGVAVILFKPLWWAHQRLKAASAGLTRGLTLAPFVWLVPPAWCMALGMFANAYLDRSPPEEHVSEVVRITTGKNSSVHFRECAPGDGDLRLSGGNGLVQGLTQGQAVTIVTRRGLFGWARIVAIRPGS